MKMKYIGSKTMLICIVVISTIIFGCSDTTIIEPSSKKSVEQKDVSSNFFNVYINLKPQERFILTGQEVGFNGWSTININSDGIIEFKINNQETILEMQYLSLSGTRIENIEIINHGSIEEVNVSIEILN